MRRRVREEDEHVHRYMAAMDVRFSNTWQVLSGDHPSYDPVMVPSLWVSTARTSGTASGLDYSIVFDLYNLEYIDSNNRYNIEYITSYS